MPSGGGGRSGGSGGNAAAAGEAVEEPGGITPGEALTSAHVSGDKDMARYWALNATVSDEGEQALTLGGEELDIYLSGGAFTAAVEGDVLTLSAEAGDLWRVNGYALKILSISGIAELRLSSGGGAVTIPTEGYLSGTAYDALRAQGLVSKDFTIEIALAGGVSATVDAAGEAHPVDGVTMILNAGGE
jgi:hypothetical protein